MIPHHAPSSGLAAMRGLQAVTLLALAMLVAGCQGVLDLGPAASESRLETATGQETLARIRSEHGLPPVFADPQLAVAARRQAELMAQSGRMAHTTGWRRDFTSRMRGSGIGGTAAENIAAGGMKPAEVFSMWMNSTGHRRNMLDPRFRRFGLASAVRGDDPRQRYWALVLSE